MKKYKMLMGYVRSSATAHHLRILESSTRNSIYWGAYGFERRIFSQADFHKPALATVTGAFGHTVP
jgi:hypothetical protein